MNVVGPSETDLENSGESSARVSPVERRDRSDACQLKLEQSRKKEKGAFDANPKGANHGDHCAIWLQGDLWRWDKATPITSTESRVRLVTGSVRTKPSRPRAFTRPRRKRRYGTTAKHRFCRRESPHTSSMEKNEKRHKPERNKRRLEKGGIATTGRRLNETSNWRRLNLRPRVARQLPHPACPACTDGLFLPQPFPAQLLPIHRTAICSPISDGG